MYDAPLALTDAQFSAYVCLFAGLVAFALGLTVGAVQTFTLRAKGTTDQAKAKVEDAQTKLSAIDDHVDVAVAANAGSSEATTAGDNAKDAASEAQSALAEASAIIAALPEKSRFAGLLVLVGTILIGVAAVQFNGVQLF